MKVLINIIADPRDLPKICEKLKSIPEVRKVYEITGEYDVFLEVEVSSINEFRKLLNNKILKTEGVKLTESSIVLEEWK